MIDLQQNHGIIITSNENIIKSNIDCAVRATASIKEKCRDPGIDIGILGEDSTHKVAIHCKRKAEARISSNILTAESVHMVINDMKYGNMIQGEIKEVNPAAKGAPSDEVLFLFGDLCLFCPHALARSMSIYLRHQRDKFKFSPGR